MSTENKTVESIPAITIRFAGDSGDGMQLVGTRFTDTSAVFGNDLATLPAFPAEIRAPQGTIAGVSSFQVQIADFDILTPGDNPDVLVAMNPAALKAHLHDLAPNGMLILNEDAFEEKNITKAGYKVDPRESGELDGYSPDSLGSTLYPALVIFFSSKASSFNISIPFGAKSWR